MVRGRAEVIAGGGGTRRAKVRAGEVRGAAVIHGVIRSRSREEARVGVGVREVGADSLPRHGEEGRGIKEKPGEGVCAAECN